MLLDLRSLYEIAVDKPVRVGGGYPRQAPYQRVPIYRLNPGIWLVLYAADALNEEELAALLATK